MTTNLSSAATGGYYHRSQHRPKSSDGEEKRTAFSPGRGHRPPPPAAACRRSAPQGVARLSAVWTGGVGWVTVERQGFTGVEGLGTTGWKMLRGAPRRWTARAYPKLISYNRVAKG